MLRRFAFSGVGGAPKKDAPQGGDYHHQHSRPEVRQGEACNSGGDEEMRAHNFQIVLNVHGSYPLSSSSNPSCSISESGPTALRETNPVQRRANNAAPPADERRHGRWEETVKVVSQSMEEIVLTAACFFRRPDIRRTAWVPYHCDCRLREGCDTAEVVAT